MILFIIIFGALICLAGLVILIKPDLIIGLLRDRIEVLGLHILAIVMRLLLGAFLVLQADVSRYPGVIGVLGWLSIFAACVLLFIGRGNFIRLMNWSLSKAGSWGRPAGFLATALGAFMVHAFT